MPVYILCIECHKEQVSQVGESCLRCKLQQSLNQSGNQKPPHKCIICHAPVYTQGTECGRCQLDKIQNARRASRNAQANQQMKQAAQAAQQARTSRYTYCKNCGVAYNTSNWVMCPNCASSNFPPNQAKTPKGDNVPISCRIYWDDSIGGYAVSCSYRPEFVQFLKQNIPASDRAFHPHTKAWSFNEKYFDIITKFAKATFGESSVNATPRSTSSSSPVGTGSSADPLTLAYAKFARLLPHDVLKKAYREAANLMHPDKGGDPRRMSDLNEAWALIKVTIQ